MRSHLRPLLPLFVVLAFAYWVTLFVLTHVPSVHLPDITLIDKICHALAYAALAFAIGSVLTIWRGYQARLPIWIWTIAVSYGAIDEYTQQFVHNRTCDIFDLLADATGASVGLLALHIAVLFARRLRSEPALSKVPVEI
jgi:VanZ family protein